jgi:hypothetical protein
MKIWLGSQRLLMAILNFIRPFIFPENCPDVSWTSETNIQPRIRKGIDEIYGGPGCKIWWH